MLAWLILALFLSGLAFAAIHDVATMTIPNWVSIAFAVLFLPAALLVGADWASIGWHYLYGFVGLIVCIGLFSVGVFGGGDAKLLPAVLIWMGPGATLPYIYGIALSGGVLALVFILSRRLIPQTAIPGFLHRSVVEGPGVPYAVAIAFGAIWAAKSSVIVSQIIGLTGLAY